MPSTDIQVPYCIIFVFTFRLYRGHGICLKVGRLDLGIRTSSVYYSVFDQAENKPPLCGPCCRVCVACRGMCSRRRAAPARISACTCLMTLSSYFKHFPMQQLSTFLQIPSGSDFPHESLFEVCLRPQLKYKTVIFNNKGHALLHS